MPAPRARSSTEISPSGALLEQPLGGLAGSPLALVAADARARGGRGPERLGGGRCERGIALSRYTGVDDFDKMLTISTQC